MTVELPHILVVDDEPVNLEIIGEQLSELDCQVSFANNGEEAINMLEDNPENFDVILLDRMMPKMTGLEVLQRISEHPILKHCPVIMQTAMAENNEVLEGINAGAYYYVTKPFDGDVLVSIVNSAIADRKQFLSLQSDVDKGIRPLKNMKYAEFSVKTLQEARDLAMLIANSCLETHKVVLGLSEILINSVEHGNLTISYDDKTTLNNEGRWEQEVTDRLQQDEYKNRHVTLTYQHNDAGYHITVKDEGQGFEWEDYMAMSPERATHNHGRGIAMAVMLGFTKIEYRGCGNEVYLFLAHS